MYDIPCIIFAGGRSSRMGEDKSLLPFASFPTLAQYQLNRLQKIFKNVYISCKSKNKFDFEAKFIEDIPTDNLFAPTAGFVSIFKELKEDRVFILSVDSPFVSYEEIRTIIDADNSSLDVTIASTPAGIQPMCGIYHKTVEPKFLQMIKEDRHKLHFLLKSSNTKYVSFEDEQKFFNLNNPQEYQEALTLI